MKRILLLCAGCLLLLACPPADDGKDAGSKDAQTADAATADSATDPDASSADTWAPDTWAPDNSVWDAACVTPTFTACDGVSPSGNSYTLILDTPGISGTYSHSIGDSRADVTTEFSGVTETIAPFNLFASIYCSEGLIFYFADNLGADDANEGVLSDDDTLYKIVAYGDFDGATSGAAGLSLGQTATEATTALGAADYTGSGTSPTGVTGEYRFYNGGHSILLVDDAVSTISVFAAQTADTIDAQVNLSGGGVGGVSITHSMMGALPAADGSTISQVRGQLGANPEAEGDTPISIGGIELDFLILSYSSLGIRLIGPSTQYRIGGDEITGDARKVYMAVLTPPFQGTTSGGIGLHSTQAEVEAELGAPYGTEVGDDGERMFKYNSGQKKVGVVYYDDTNCDRRAGLFVVNLIES